MNETCPECHGRQRSSTTRPARPATAAAAGCPAGRSRPASRPASRTASGSAQGQGRRGRERDPAGDLLVTVHVRPHRIAIAQDNLTLEAPVTFDEAALGAEIKVPTLVVRR